MCYWRTKKLPMLEFRTVQAIMCCRARQILLLLDRTSPFPHQSCRLTGSMWCSATQVGSPDLYLTSHNKLPHWPKCKFDI